MHESHQANSVFSIFKKIVNQYPSGPCLCSPPMQGRPYYPEGFEFTYEHVYNSVLAIQLKFAAAGYGVGHRIALLLENRPEAHIYWWALNGLGVSIVPINPSYTPQEIEFLLTHSECVAVVSVPERMTDLSKVIKTLNQSLPLINSADMPNDLSGAICESLGNSLNKDNEAALMYTSGTTGNPKGCILSNRFFINAGGWYLEAGGKMAIKPGSERLLNPLPLYHANALAISSMAMLMSGGCIIMIDRFHPKTWWEDAFLSKATIIHYLGVMPPLLLNQEEGEYDNSHRIKFGAGAGIDPKHHQLFEERFGFPLVEGWGMTEVAMPTWSSTEPRKTETRAFGRPLSGCQIRVVDENDNEVSPGVAGELTLRMEGKNPRKGLFSGYLKDSEATETAWRGGWFHSGDTVTCASDGMLTFVDRAKNIIRRSGENIAAAEVEAVLQSNKFVIQAAVIAVSDEIRQEEVMACVILNDSIDPDMATAIDIQDYCLAELTYYKVPGYIMFVRNLPTTSTQKVSKVRLFDSETDPRELDGCIDLRERKKRSG